MSSKLPNTFLVSSIYVSTSLSNTELTLSSETGVPTGAPYSSSVAFY